MSMLDVCVRGTLLLGLGFAGLGVLRRSSAAARHLLLASTLVGLLALPVLSLVVPSLTVTVPAALNASPAPVNPTRETPSVDAAAAVVRPYATTPDASPSPAIDTRPAVSLWWLLWALGAAAVVARLALGLWRVRRLVARTTVVSQPEWTRLVSRVSRSIGLRRRVALHMGPAGAVPMTCGSLHPIVILPADAQWWDDERRTVVLTHELAHVRRFDVLTHLVGQLAVAAFWFHPLVWLAAARMRAECERACDDLVLTAGVRPSRYAGDLLELVQTLRGTAAPAVAALAMGRRTEIEARLLAILDGAARRGPLGSRRIAVALGAAAAAVGTLAAVHPVSASPIAVVAFTPVRVVGAPVDDDRRRRVPPEIALANRATDAASLGSDAAKRGALLQVARLYCGHDTLRRAFFAATRTIGSDVERRRVLVGLLGSGKRDAATVVAVLRSTAAMASDADKAIVLRRVAEGDALADRAVRREFVAAANTIASSVDRADVLASAGET
jgi:beta-lactamase regulating signal transducer with metallopeptidase domain